MIINLLKKRASVREFSDRKINKEVLNTILEAGRLSPSGGNEQPWLFGVIDDSQVIKEIATISYNQKWLNTAPLIIVLCAKIYDKNKGGRNICCKRFPSMVSEIENMDDNLFAALNAEEHQTNIAGTHMVLAALEHGIYSTWLSYFDVNKLNAILNLPSDCIATEMIAFGYPKKDVKVRSKKPLKDIVFYNKY